MPSLLGLAYNVPYFDGIICSIIDARNNNVYAALYEFNNKPNLIGDYISDSIDTLLERLKDLSKKVLFIGDGAISYKDTFISALNEKAFFVPYHLNFQTATSIAKAAMDKANNDEFDDYNTLNPMYLKKSQAERMLDLNGQNSNN